MSLLQEQKAPFRELVEEGKTDEEIRQSMGITQQTINQEKKILRSLGLLEYKDRGRMKREITDELRTAIVSKAEKGLTNAEIAYSLSMSVQTLLKYKKMIRDEGIEIPNNAPMGRPKTVKKCPHCGGVLS